MDNFVIVGDVDRLHIKQWEDEIDGNELTEVFPEFKSAGHPLKSFNPPNREMTAPFLPDFPTFHDSINIPNQSSNFKPCYGTLQIPMS
jgi:hypothetical protein